MKTARLSLSRHVLPAARLVSGLARWFCFALLLVCAGAVSQAQAACSPYHGFSTINEVYINGNSDRFIEVKLLDTGIDSSIYGNWTVTACAGGFQWYGGWWGATCSGPLSLSGADSSNFPWVVIPKAQLNRNAIDLRNGMSVLLQDGNGDTIDYLSVNGYDNNQDASCTPAYDWQAPSTNTHALFRDPDGNGTWVDEAGNSGGDTQGGSNAGSGSPLVSITDAIVSPGDTAVFDVTMDQTSSSDVTVTYQTQDASAVAGTDYTAQSGTITIPAGSTGPITISVPTASTSGGGLFYVFLSSATNASMNDQFGQGYIREGGAAYYPMDEPSWNGTAGEVTDNSSSSFDATAQGGATTDNTAPALAGDPGTCGYGVFDNYDNYVALPPGFPNETASFTITAWIKPQRISGDQRIFADDANNNGGYAFSLGDGGDGRLRFFSRTVNPISLDSGPVVNTGTWQFVAAVMDANKRQRRIYLGTSLVAQDASSGYSGSWGADSGIATIGGETATSSEGAPGSRWHFDGNIDEVHVFARALTANELRAVMDERHSCSTPAVDHFEIVHDGSALTCQPETVTVRACADAACSTLYTGSVTISLSPAGWVGGDTQTFSGGSHDFQLRHSTAEVVSLGVGSSTPASVNGYSCTGGAPGACDINFHDTGFVFDVPDQTACTVSNPVTVSAVRKDNTSEACVPAFGNVSKQVNFWSTYSSPTTGDDPLYVTPSGGSATAVGSGAANATPLTLNFDGNGQAGIAVSYADAGRLQLDASYTETVDGQTLTLTGNDLFVVSPDSLYLSATTDGATALNAPDAGSSPVWPAGKNFRMQIRGQCADGTITNNYQPTNAEMLVEQVLPASSADTRGGTLSLRNGSTSVAGDYSGSAAWTNISGQFAGGVVANGGQSLSDPNSYADAAYSEVGVIRVSMRDSNYLGGAVGATGPLTVGRFTPDHFQTLDPGSTGTLGNACTAGANAFTYTGQDFQYAMGGEPSFQAQAKNAAGADTWNYTGAFNKLAAGPVTASLPTSGGDGLVNDSNGNPMQWSRTAGSVSATDQGKGLNTVTLSGDTYQYPRTGGDGRTQVKPFSPTISLDINSGSYSDSDGVSNVEGSPVPAMDLSGAGTSIRYGRLNILNSYGPETQDLPVKMQAEQFDGQAYVANTDDACTSGLTVVLTDADPSDSLATANTCVIGVGGCGASGAVSGRNLAQPPPSGDFNLWLKAPDNGAQGPLNVTATGLPAWLQYDWDGDGNYDNAPSAQATFGVYKGSDNMIYRHEITN